MAYIRKTKTASGATAIQAVKYEKRKMIILKHFGSAKNRGECEALVDKARAWISDYTGQLLVFPQQERNHLRYDGLERCVGVRYSCAYTVLTQMLKYIGFTRLNDSLLRDLVVMRIFEPSSKLRAIELLSRYFDITYAERTLYRKLRKLCTYKEKVEAIAISFAKKRLKSDLSFILYDVTTLFFESFEPDDLRKHGFSKDNKPAQPQIVVGLLVNSDGFPLQYEIFPGNTFEGKTMLPILKKFRKKHKTRKCCIVADAAMMSLQNMEKLKKEGCEYIVGARVANLPAATIDTISGKLSQHKDGTSIRISTDHGDLIASFSSSRYRKNKREMEKHIIRAKRLVAVNEPGKRAKFVSSASGRYELNEKLIEKTAKLLGIRGYYTNIPPKKMSNDSIIAHYGNLWRVEHAFRMSKSDLVARPIFHHKEDAIKAHMVICFIALAVGRYLELKSGLSLRKIVNQLRLVQDARIVHMHTKKEILLPAFISDDIEKLLKKVGMSY